MNKPEEDNTSLDTQNYLVKKWLDLFFWLGFSALEIYVLVSGAVGFDDYKGWIILIGAIGFPIAAINSAFSLAKDERNYGISKILSNIFLWLLVSPIALITLFLAGWILYKFAGWLATIPSWAAVIIILLLMKK